MGRHRTNKADNALPKYVYPGKVAYEWRPYQGRGLKRPCFALAPLDAPLSRVWEEWEKRQGQPVYDLAWLLTTYMASAQFKALAPKTIKTQREAANVIIGYPRGGGKTFGTAGLKAITRGVMRKYLDAREAADAPVAGNREKALISRAWNWALERDLISWTNPCKGVRRNKETPKTRYVTDEEYEVAYGLAQSPAWMRPSMELMYLCRMRGEEVRQALKDDVAVGGFMTRRLKGSKDALTQWSDRLQAAILAALATSPETDRLIANREGTPIKEDAWHSAWQRLRKKMKTAGMEPFSGHDLKAKGVTDFEGDKMAAGGWTSPQMVNVYDRQPGKVKPTR